MLGALSNILENIHFGPYKRKVKRYLDETTTDSLLEDLRKALTPGLVEIKDIRTTFNAFSIEDTSSHQRYWNKDSLRNHISSRHPHTIISDATIQLLWRCFCFYAYHPFPHDAFTNDSGVDSAAFQRAVSLLVLQGTELLGTQDGGDYFWRHDTSFFRQADFKRIFRSISTNLPLGTSSEKAIQWDHDIVSDTMDVLAMTQPYTVCLAPSPDQLELVAQKLVTECPLQMLYLVSRNDLSNLLSLLLRVRLQKDKWGSRFHLGFFDNADHDNEELVSTLVNEISEDKETLTSNQILRAMDLLPNLQLRFYQLWAVLFQPKMTTTDEVQSSKVKIEGIPNFILSAVSLFIPGPEFFGHSHMRTTQDMRIALEKLVESSDESGNLTVARLVKSLTQDLHPYLLVITSNEKSTSKPGTIIGAYFPGPLWFKCNEDTGDAPKFGTGTSHLLFQLTPQFRLLRWTRPRVPLTDIIKMDDDEVPSLDAIVGCDGIFPTLSMTYRIGSSDGKGSSLRISPETGSAVLKINPTDINYNDVACFKDAYRDNSGGHEWETTVNHAQLEIFTVAGGVDANLATEGISRKEDYAQCVRGEAQQKIKGEELKMRIQGFGSP